jgi:chorismate mutase
LAAAAQIKSRWESKAFNKAELVKVNAGLKACQRFIINKKGCLYRAIVSPKSNGTPRVVI